jgi:formylglycine-generating enzyme required for sulfatase activity
VQEFIKYLNARNGTNYRLPTEAEWEYAARSGGKNEKYSGGNNVDSVAWYKGNSGTTTHPVGKQEANGLGIHDMSGNVREWVGDWYGSYVSSRQHDLKGPSTGLYRVDRGGSWDNDPKYVRAVYRYRYDPGYRYNNLGFRLVEPVQ